MPLKKGSSNKAVSDNISTLMKDKTPSGKPKFTKAQAIAISLKKAGRSKRKEDGRDFWPGMELSVWDAPVDLGF